jgi:hypothetical protein
LKSLKNMPIEVASYVNASVTSICLLYTCLSFLLLQHGVPAFTVPQPDEAMHVLEEKASQLDVSCTVFSLVSSVSHTVGMCIQ